MAVRTNRLGGPTLVASMTTSTLYTCPAGRTAIVKFLTQRGTSATAARITYLLRVAGVDLPLRSDDAAVTNAGLVVWWVVEAGESIKVTNDGGFGVYIALHGTELEGVPS